MILLALNVRCPCGQEPPIRIAERERERYELDDPGLFVGTFRCSKCQRVNRLTAAAYQQAIEPLRQASCA